MKKTACRGVFGMRTKEFSEKRAIPQTLCKFRWRLVVQCAWISAWGLRTNPDTQLLWWRGPCEHLGRHRQFTGVLLGMDLQIKNQQMKDKGICEDAELTEEMKLFLEQPIGVFLKQYFSWRGERKERKVWAWFHHWSRKKGNNLYRSGEVPLFCKMSSRIESTKDLSAKTTPLQEADPRMLHRGGAHAGTAARRCWMLRLKEVPSEQLSHWSRIVWTALEDCLEIDMRETNRSTARSWILIEWSEFEKNIQSTENPKPP